MSEHKVAPPLLLQATHANPFQQVTESENFPPFPQAITDKTDDSVVSTSLSIDAQAALNEHTRHVAKFGLDLDESTQRVVQEVEGGPQNKDTSPSRHLDYEWDRLLDASTSHVSVTSSMICDPGLLAHMMDPKKGPIDDSSPSDTRMTVNQDDDDDRNGSSYFDSSRVWDLTTPERVQTQSNAEGLCCLTYRGSFDDSTNEEGEGPPGGPPQATTPPCIYNSMDASRSSISAAESHSLMSSFMDMDLSRISRYTGSQPATSPGMNSSIAMVSDAFYADKNENIECIDDSQELVSPTDEEYGGEQQRVTDLLLRGPPQLPSPTKLGGKQAVSQQPGKWFPRLPSPTKSLCARFSSDDESCAKVHHETQHFKECRQRSSSSQVHSSATNDDTKANSVRQGKLANILKHKWNRPSTVVISNRSISSPRQITSIDSILRIHNVPSPQSRTSNYEDQQQEQKYHDSPSSTRTHEKYVSNGTVESTASTELQMDDDEEKTVTISSPTTTIKTHASNQSSVSSVGIFLSSPSVGITPSAPKERPILRKQLIAFEQRLEKAEEEEMELESEIGSMKDETDERTLEKTSDTTAVLTPSLCESSTNRSSSKGDPKSCSIFPSSLPDQAGQEDFPSNGKPYPTSGMDMAENSQPTDLPSPMSRPDTDGSNHQMPSSMAEKAADGIVRSNCLMPPTESESDPNSSPHDMLVDQDNEYQNSVPSSPLLPVTNKSRDQDEKQCWSQNSVTPSENRPATNKKSDSEAQSPPSPVAVVDGGVFGPSSKPIRAANEEKYSTDKPISNANGKYSSRSKPSSQPVLISDKGAGPNRNVFPLAVHVANGNDSLALSSPSQLALEKDRQNGPILLVRHNGNAKFLPADLNNKSSPSLALTANEGNNLTFVPSSQPGVAVKEWTSPTTQPSASIYAFNGRTTSISISYSRTLSPFGDHAQSSAEYSHLGTETAQKAQQQPVANGKHPQIMPFSQLVLTRNEKNGPNSQPASIPEDTVKGNYRSTCAPSSLVVAVTESQNGKGRHGFSPVTLAENGDFQSSFMAPTQLAQAGKLNAPNIRNSLVPTDIKSGPPSLSDARLLLGADKENRLTARPSLPVVPVADQSHRSASTQSSQVLLATVTNPHPYNKLALRPVHSVDENSLRAPSRLMHGRDKSNRPHNHISAWGTNGKEANRRMIAVPPTQLALVRDKSNHNFAFRSADRVEETNRLVIVRSCHSNRSNKQSSNQPVNGDDEITSKNRKKDYAERRRFRTVVPVRAFVDSSNEFFPCDDNFSSPRVQQSEAYARLYEQATTRKMIV